MKADYPAVLDACVLLPMPLADTLLRMAETPRLYLPKWSNEILEEVSRNLTAKMGKTAQQATRRISTMKAHFPEALIAGYEPLISAMTNDPKDRHVLAASVSCGSKLIVTYNRRHFPLESLLPYGMECQGPSTFLINLYDLDPGIVVQKLSEQASNVGLDLQELLRKLQKNVPEFVSFFCEEQVIDL